MLEGAGDIEVSSGDTLFELACADSEAAVWDDVSQLWVCAPLPAP